MTFKKNVLKFFLVLGMFTPLLYAKVPLQKKNSSSFFAYPLRKKIGAFFVGAILAMGSEALIHYSPLENGCIRLIGRLSCATGSTLLLLRTIKQSENFFDFFGIGYDSIVLANIARLLVESLKKGTLKAGNAFDVLILLLVVLPFCRAAACHDDHVLDVLP